MSGNPRPAAQPRRLAPLASSRTARPTTRAQRLTRWAASVAVLALPLGALAPTAAGAAAVVEPPRPAFYEAPATLPATNGAVIRTETQPFVLDVAQVATKVKDARRVLYRTTNRTGTPIAVSGTVIVPKAPWVGLGKRPIIAYAAGTQGLADRCAPSRAFAESLEYEWIGIAGLLARGYAIAMTDYEGLGTAGVHTYMDRVSQGRAVLDVVRAAQRMGFSGIDSSNPVGLQGYSQGGAAAASAAELASSYAPELKIRGAVVGAVPADLAGLAEGLEGSLWSSFAFFAMRGLSASYGLDLDPYLNATGKQVLRDIEQDCTFDLFSNAFRPTRDVSATGTPMYELMKTDPFKTMADDQRIGRLKPSMPILVTQSRLDEIVPFNVGKGVAKSWCGKGANVRFSANVAPLHVGGMLPHSAEALPYWEARFAGLPQLNGCGLI